MSRIVKCPLSQGFVEYTNEALGSVLFMEVSQFRGVLIEGFHCAYTSVELIFTKCSETVVNEKH